MEDWYDINFNKSKNIAYFSCLRGAIDKKLTLEQEISYHKDCLEKWEKWYLQEFPRPQDENERSLNQIKNI